MTAEWIEYTGSDEQNETLFDTPYGFLIKNSNYEVLGPIFSFEAVPADFFVSHYLICNPHPNADMICQQARTGQPVWIKVPLKNNDVPNNYANHPDLVELRLHQDCAIFKKAKNIEWNIPGAKYSFEPFED